jgi:Fe2+ transport system protein B
MGKNFSKERRTEGLDDDEKFELYRDMREKTYKDKLGRLFKGDQERIDVLKDRAEICAENLKETRQELMDLQDRAALQASKVLLHKRYYPFAFVVLVLLFCAVFAVVAGLIVARGFQKSQIAPG